MKAIVCTRYGSPDYLQLQDLPTPEPRENELLIRVHASTVTAADTMMRRAKPWFSRLFLGLTRPKNAVTGTGWAGEVVAKGEHVQKYQPGEQVFGETGVEFGANAEFVRVAEDGVITTLPGSISYKEAAPICDGALTSFNFLKKIGQIRQGHQVLIIGAAGGLGTSAVQLARHFGAEVTGVCSSRNFGLVKELGAHRVIDYKNEDYTRGNQQYDLIFDTVGKSSFSACKRILTKDGQYLSPVLKFSLLLQMMTTSLRGSQKARFSATGLLPPAELRPMLEEIKQLVVDGKLKTVIDQEFPLEQTPDAHRYVDRGHKKGNVVINVMMT